jgi:hypothetical protein
VANSGASSRYNPPKARKSPSSPLHQTITDFGIQSAEGNFLLKQSLLLAQAVEDKLVAHKFTGDLYAGVDYCVRHRIGLTAQRNIAVSAKIPLVPQVFVSGPELIKAAVAGIASIKAQIASLDAILLSAIVAIAKQEGTAPYRRCPPRRGGLLENQWWHRPLAIGAQTLLTAPDDYDFPHLWYTLRQTGAR